MNPRKTSRVLNDNAFLLGLTYNDISGCGVLLLVLLLIFRGLGIKSMLIPLLAACTALVVLIPIRLKYRKKILRDSLSYLFSNGVIYVSKNRRVRKYPRL